MDKLTSLELLVLSIMLTRLRANPTIGQIVTLSDKEIDELSEKITKAVEEGRL